MRQQIPGTPDLPPPFLAALADRYTIERELGRGRNAVVYLARDIKHSRNVALKVMPFVEGESLRARLERDPQLPIEDAVRITRDVVSHGGTEYRYCARNVAPLPAIDLDVFVSTRTRTDN